MNPFEYLLLFAAVILGLAVSDLAISLHRTLGAGARVKWGWLTPLAAILALLKIVTQWWAWYEAAKYAQGLTFGMFLAVVASSILLFLMSAAALPDRVERDAPVVDLDTHYWAISRRFWLLFAAHELLVNAVGVWAQMQIKGARLELLGAGPALVLGLIAVAVSLAVWRNRWWHTGWMVVLVGFYGVQSFGQTLS
jgi:hypothetical protein